MIDINIKGLNDVNTFLKAKSKETEKLTSDGIIKAGIFMQGKVKLSIAGRESEPTSVDTGNFLRSVDFNRTKDTAVIFSPVSYAKYLEFGTSKVAPRFHFRNTKKRYEEKAIKIMEGEISKL